MLEVDSNRIKIVVPTVTRDSVGANLAKSFPQLNLTEVPKPVEPVPQLQVRSLHQDAVSPRRSTTENSPCRTNSNQNVLDVRRNSNETLARPNRSSSDETVESPRSVQNMSATLSTSPRPLPSVPSMPKVPVSPAKLPPPPPPLVMRANSKGTMEATTPPLPPPRSPSPGQSPQVSPRVSMPPQYAPPLPPNQSNNTMPHYPPPLPPNSMPPPPPVLRVKK